MEVISLTEEQKKELQSYYEKKISELEKQLDTYRDLYNKLNAPKGKKSTHRKKYTWKSLSLQILREQDKLLRTDEIYERALEIDPQLNARDRRSVVSSISGSLSQLASDGDLEKIDDPYGNGNFWGMPQWFFDLDGQPYPKRDYAQELNEKGYNFQVVDESDIVDLSDSHRTFSEGLLKPPIRSENLKLEDLEDDFDDLDDDLPY